MRLAECDARLLQICRLGRRSLSLGSFGHLQRHPIGMQTFQTRLYVLLFPPPFCYSSAIFPGFLISFLESPDLLVAFAEIPYLSTQRTLLFLVAHNSDHSEWLLGFSFFEKRIIFTFYHFADSAADTLWTVLFYAFISNIH